MLARSLGIEILSVRPSDTRVIVAFNVIYVGQLPIFNLSRDVSTTTISKQPKGHPGLNSLADEVGKSKGKGK